MCNTCLKECWTQKFRSSSRPHLLLHSGLLCGLAWSSEQCPWITFLLHHGLFFSHGSTLLSQLLLSSCFSLAQWCICHWLRFDQQWVPFPDGQNWFLSNISKLLSSAHKGPPLQLTHYQNITWAQYNYNITLPQSEFLINEGWPNEVLTVATKWRT